MNSANGLDRAMEAMRNRYRRRILFELRERRRDSGGDTLRIATLSFGSDGDAEANVRLLLRHSHLPKLENFGYISWGRDAGTITKGPEWDEIAPFVRLVADQSDERPDRSRSRPTRGRR